MRSVNPMRRSTRRVVRERLRSRAVRRKPTIEAAIIVSITAASASNTTTHECIFTTNDTYEVARIATVPVYTTSPQRIAATSPVAGPMRRMGAGRMV